MDELPPPKKGRRIYPWWAMTKVQHDRAVELLGHPLTQDPITRHHLGQGHNDIAEFA